VGQAFQELPGRVRGDFAPPDTGHEATWAGPRMKAVLRGIRRTIGSAKLPRAGASIWKLSEVSRHRSLDTLRGYVRRVDLFKEHAGASFL
jgi:hypothetical protein